jgi:hypothetical protein
LPESGSTYFKNKKVEEEDCFVCHQLNVKTVEGYKFYEINEIKEDELPYEICSKSPFITVSIPDKNKIASFGKSYFFMKEGHHNEDIEVTILVNHEESKDQVTVKVSPDNLNFRKVEKINVRG